MIWKQLPIIIYIGLPNTFKSFCIKVKDRSSYSINIQIYRCSPNPYSWRCEPKDLKICCKILYPNKHIHEKDSNFYLPFVFVSRMCPTPNPNKKKISLNLSTKHLHQNNPKIWVIRVKSRSYKRYTFVTRKREKLIKQKRFSRTIRPNHLIKTTIKW